MVVTRWTGKAWLGSWMFGFWIVAEFFSVKSLWANRTTGKCDVMLLEYVMLKIFLCRIELFYNRSNGILKLPKFSCYQNNLKKKKQGNKCGLTTTAYLEPICLVNVCYILANQNFYFGPCWVSELANCLFPSQLRFSWSWRMIYEKSVLYRCMYFRKLTENGNAEARLWLSKHRRHKINKRYFFG